MRTILILLLALVLTFQVSALEIMPMPPYPDRTGFGSNQWYSVFLDGEGEALIAAKLQVYNAGQDPIDTVTLEIPGASVRIMVLLQELPTKQQQCVQQETYCAAYSPESVCTAWGPGGAGDCVKFEKPCMRQEQRCVQHQETVGYPYTYVPINSPKETLSQSTKMTVPLAHKIDAQQQGTLLIYYKAADVAEKSLGVWTFDVETLKWGLDTNQVRVAVNVEPGFFLKGQNAEVEYRPAMVGAFAAAKEMTVAAPSPELSDASNRIMYEQGWVRETRGLDPWESFRVQGAYSKSRFLLQKTAVFITLLVIAGLLAGGIFGVRRLMRWRVQTNTPSLVIVGGLVSSVVLMVSWWLIVFVMKNLSRWMNYRYSELVIPIALLASIVWFLVWMFGPAVFVGAKTENMIAGILTLVCTIGWLVLLLIGVVIVLSATMGSSGIYGALSL